MSIRRGLLEPEERRSGHFEFGHLPDMEKRELCVGLLNEFGVKNINRRGDEMIHSCCLPNSGHRNGDRNPSASLNWRKLTYNCLGCGSHGGLLWLIGLCRGMDDLEARAWLSSNTSFGQSTMDLSSLIEFITNVYAAPETRAPVPQFDPAMLDPWTDWDGHHEYLTCDGQIPGTRIIGRGIHPETLEHFRVGYADEYFDGTERIVIPIFWQQKLVGWQARAMPGYKGSDKYRNSPEFPRDEVLFNYDRRRDAAVLVESPMSVLRHFHHRPEMTATLGAKVGDPQIQRCQQFPVVTLWFDNDDAGWSATYRVGKALSRHARVWVVESPWAADPADMDDGEVERLLTECRVPYSIWSPPKELIKWKRRS